MNGRTERAAEWVYRGVWRVLSSWFRVPEHPPTLPAAPTSDRRDFLLSFHPSRRYLAYLKLWFWFALVAVDAAILVGWLAVYLADRRIGLWLAAPALIVAVVPDVLAYVAIHLRYDTMWYVMTDRSLRCRRGILVLLEHTITFENVQNVNVQRGPVEYLFGISTLVVETAGAAEGEHENRFAVGNKAILQGIADPDEIRRLILERVRRSRSAGLGDERDERDEPRDASTAWTADHVRTLREILEEVRAHA